MTMLTKIGNSQGIRIPKPLIAQAGLENSQIELEIVGNGLLLKPIHRKPRDNWEQNIDEILKKNDKHKDEALLSDMMDDSDLEEYQW